MNVCAIVLFDASFISRRDMHFFIFGHIIKTENLISIDLKVTDNFNLSCPSANGEANLESLILISSTSKC